MDVRAEISGSESEEQVWTDGSALGGSKRKTFYTSATAHSWCTASPRKGCLRLLSSILRLILHTIADSPLVARRWTDSSEIRLARLLLSRRPEMVSQPPECVNILSVRLF